ncbi:MAG: flagellar motor switch protein FliM, partial [Phycisphaerales bacterium]|nr:flagellar motor switch protein FliM [Phycisphaerales bacterium]
AGEQPRPQIFSRFRRDLEKVEIRPYDFKRPERISKDQMRALHTLHEAFARSFGASMSGFLRTIVEVKVAHTEQMTYSEFIAGLPNPTSFNLIDCAPLEGRICLEVSPLIIYPIIDRLLGGTNRDLFVPQRPMTLIETRLIQKILHRGMTALSEAWEGLRKIDFSLGEMESNPQLVQIVPPNEVVVVIGFELKLVNRAGTMSLCIPFNTVEPIMEDLSAQSWFAADKGRAGPQYEASIERNLGRAELEIEAILAETHMTVSDLRNLEVGDLILTERSSSAPVQVNIEGRPKYLATLGQYKGQRALCIDGPVKQSD